MKRERIAALILAAFLFIVLVAAASCTPPVWGPDWGPHWPWSPFWAFPFSILGLALYLVPTIVAAFRHHPNLLTIVLVNVFAGWTVIGWIITLIWALSSPHRR